MAIRGRFPAYASIVLLLTLVSTATARYSGGTGEPNDPYQIATAADLIALGETPEDYDKHFILTADIDLDPSLPGRKVFDEAVIAPDTNPADEYGFFQGTPFTGIFEGNGHTISHLTVKGGGYLGLFGGLGTEGQVKGLGMLDVNMRGSGKYVGGLVGYDYRGSLFKCHSTGVVTGTDWCVGGLVGVNSEGVVTQCYSAGTVTGTEEGVGGLVGWNYGDVTYCHSSAVVNGEDGAGGLVGNNAGAVTQCYSTDAVSGTGYLVGGLVGWNYGDVTACYSTGPVIGGGGVGGLVGQNSHAVTQCYSTGAVSGGGSVGGLVGVNAGAQVTTSYSTGVVSGIRDNIGGLVGDNGMLSPLGPGTVTASFWDTQTSGQATSGAGTGLTTVQMQDVKTYLNAKWDFVGEGPNGLHEVWQMPQGGGYPVLAILNGYVPCQLHGAGTLDDPYLISEALELSAMVYHSPRAHYRLATSIDLSGIDWAMPVIPRLQGTFDGNGLTVSHLTITGGSYLGLFGQLASSGVVKNLGVVDANVTGSAHSIGALTGGNGGTVAHCYSTGTVSGTEGVGGLVGDNDGTVTQCYSTGTVSGASAVGGLVGDNTITGGWGVCGGGTITNCYSSGPVSGNSYVAGLVGLNGGTLTRCYSTGVVSGSSVIAGLVVNVRWGTESYGGGGGTANDCFWDIETSGQATSAGGSGLTTGEMQTASTFLEAGWDFIGETANGTEDIWWIDEGRDYPRLWWEAPQE